MDTISKKILVEIEAKTANLKQNLIEANKELDKLYLNQQRIIAQEGVSSKAYQENASAIRITKTEISGLNRELDASVKAFNAQNNSLAQNRELIKTLTAERIRLGQADKLTSEREKELTTRINEVTEATKKQEAAMGNHTRNVGNYASATNSLSQVLREIPAFTYSVQSGILGISNNLPILIDQFKQLQVAVNANTGKANGFAGAMKIMAGSIFSFVNIFTIAFGLFTIFLPKIQEWISGVKEVDKEQEKLNETSKKTGELLFDNSLSWRELRGEISKTQAELLKINRTYDQQIDELITKRTAAIEDATGKLATMWATTKAALMRGLSRGRTDISGDDLILADLKKINDEYDANKKIIQDKRNAEEERVAIEHQENLLKLAIEHKNRMLDLQNDLDDARIRLMDEGIDKEIAKENEKFDQLLLQLSREKGKYADENAIIDKRIETETEQHKNNLLKIEMDFFNKLLAMRKANSEEDYNLTIKKFLQSEADKGAANNKGVEQEKQRFEKANETLDKLEKDKANKRRVASEREEQQNIEIAIQTGQKLSDSSFQIVNQRLQNENDAIVQGLNRQREIELSNQNLTTAQKKEIDKKYQQAILNEKIKLFNQEKKLAILQATINGALAVTKVTAQTGIGSPFIIPGIIAGTALEVAVIASQQPPAFAQGGIYNSDGKGGALSGYSKRDNINSTLRSGEGILVSEAMRVPWARNLASAINTTFGGRDFSTNVPHKGFESGGIFTDGGNSNRFYNQPVTNVEGLANSLAYQLLNNFPPVITDVKDVVREMGILVKTFDRVNF
jgi:hypothetical protein